MLKRIHVAVLVAMSVCGIGSVMQAQPKLCPGQNNPVTPTNLACELFDATGSTTTLNLAAVSTTIGTQLGQLPFATAVSGSGLTLNKSLGVFTASQGSLGTILTQRAETLGKNNFLISFTYQHFGFGSIDGIRLKDFPTLAPYDAASGGTPTAYVQAVSDISLSVDQYSAFASYGLTSRIDLALLLPFSTVNLNTLAQGTIYQVSGASAPLYPTPTGASGTHYFPGSASGLGDITLDLKDNVIKGEKTSFTVGGEVRFPSGDASNYLGSGAYGIKPYLVISRAARLTPNISLAYQWNGSSILNGNQNLPSSFLYSGGADFWVTRKLTLVGEFTGQCVINGPSLALITKSIPGPNQPTRPNTVQPYSESYAMDNLGGGLKASPFKNFFVNASVMFKLDNAGLRSKIIPLGGASYRF